MGEVRELITDEDFRTATDPTGCGNCGRWWDDSISTALTPTPAGRCPFEYGHEEDAVMEMNRRVLDRMIRENAISDLAGAIAGQAQAIADGAVPVPSAAAARLAENVDTLRAWIGGLSDG
jgi:hypothetical protein